MRYRCGDLTEREIDALEAVQRRASKIPSVLKCVNYRERLSRLRLSSLEERRVRGDLIFMYKVLRMGEPIS